MNEPKQPTPTEKVQEAKAKYSCDIISIAELMEVMDELAAELERVQKDFAQAESSRVTNASLYERALKERDQHAEQATLNATRWQECNRQLESTVKGEHCTCSDPVNDGDCASCKIAKYDELKRRLENRESDLAQMREKLDASTLACDEFKRQVEALKDPRYKQECIVRMVNERDQLRAENAELRKDKERLDWLENEDVWIGIEGEYDVSARITCGKSYSQSVRRAIDAARKESK